MINIPFNKTILIDFLNSNIDVAYKRIEYIISFITRENRFPYSDTNIFYTTNEKNYLLGVLVYIKDKRRLKILLQAKSFQFRRIIKLIKVYIPEIDDKESNIYLIFYNIFVKSTYDKIDKYIFINNINLGTCPYCNRNYIFTIDTNKNLKAEIDHFYPKSLYSYLAVSFYNLIPSCPTCNGFGAKGSQDSYLDNLKNPYEVSDDDFKFSFKINSINIINNAIDMSSIDIILKEKVEANNNYFQLENLYKKHSNIAIELYQKIYQEDTKEYFSLLQKSLKGLSFSDEDIYKFITCGEFKSDKHHERVLSKFTKDITRELGYEI